ncbi:prepilin peptidase [Paucilactobacillus sp. N302-9]
MNYLFFIYGLCWGSFLGVVIDRTYVHRSIIYPRSACDHCHQFLRWWQLIPILGYFLQRGHCHFCHNKIPLQSTVYELLFGVIFLSIYQSGWCYFFCALCFYSGLLILSATDIKEHAIYTIHLLFLLPGYLLWPSLITLKITELLLLIGTTIFLLTLGKITHGLGIGDIEIIFILQLFTGFTMIIQTIFIACTLAIIYILSKKHFSQLAFVPFIAIAFLTQQLYQNFM